MRSICLLGASWEIIHESLNGREVQFKLINVMLSEHRKAESGVSIGVTAFEVD